MKKILKILAVPILIGYLIQKYVDPPESPEIRDLSEEIQAWNSRGQMVEVGGYEMFVRTFPFTGKNEPGPTIVLIHGFPSSSFDYHKVGIDQLQEHGPVLVYDHLGFGFSDKPTENFTYSIFELAEYSIMLFRKLGLSEVICVGHDMGDTVLAELVKRRHRGTLPDYLNIKGIAFTNGGINFKYAKLRLAQHALRYSS